MKSITQKTCCINRRAGKSGLHPPVKNKTGVKNYEAGTSSSPEHPSGSQCWININLGPLDPPSTENIQKSKEQIEHARSIFNNHLINQETIL